MLVRVGLCSLDSVVVRVLMVCTSRVGVMRRLLMTAGLVMLRCFFVVKSRMLVMFCCMQVMLRCRFGHVMFSL
jgi:hypothetical protein